METKIQQIIPIQSIIVNNRLRRDLANIQDLAANIRELGLLSPIIINQDNKLLAGERRLEACKSLGWTEIPAIIKEVTDAEQELLIEIAENVNRESFTREELINAGIELERIEKVKAEERKSVSQFGSTEVENLPPPVEKGKTRDIVAKVLGMSGKQYEREKFILENRDLISEGEFDDWNFRRISTNKIFTIINRIIKKIEGSDEADGTVNKSKPEDPEVAIEKIAELEDRITRLTAENEELRNSKYVYSSSVAEADTAYDFWKASDDFTKNIIAPFSYDGVIDNNQDGVCSEYIIKACNLLIDSATDVLKRFKTNNVIDID